MTEYRITYSIQRQRDGEDDFTEIGFGAGDSSMIDDAAFGISADIQRREWETTPGMPDPSTIDKDYP